MDTKRLFFAIEVHSPWPKPLPKGRIVNEQYRHVTLAFLGNIDFDKLEPLLPELPAFPFQIGLVGKFDRCLFLPPKRPNVVSWHIQWLEKFQSLLEYREELISFLQELRWNH